MVSLGTAGSRRRERGTHRLEEFDGGRPEAGDLVGRPEMRGQLFGKFSRRPDPVHRFERRRQAQLLKSRHRLFAPLRRQRAHESELRVDFTALRRKLRVVGDDFGE